MSKFPILAPQKASDSESIELLNKQESLSLQEAWHSFIDAKCRPWSHKSDAIYQMETLSHQMAITP